jgi:hypothetical protein
MAEASSTLGIAGCVPALLQLDLLPFPTEILFGGDAEPGEPPLPFVDPGQPLQGFRAAGEL